MTENPDRLPILDRASPAVPLTCLAGGLILTLAVTWTAREALGPLCWVLAAVAGALLLAGVFIHRRMSMETDAARIAEGERRLRRVEADIRRRARRLDRRQEALYKETLGRIDLTGGEAADPPPDPIRSDEAVHEILERRTEALFEKIRKGHYNPGGRFDGAGLTADLTDLIAEVARIYNPDSESPLLETSIENLLRSINRISLKLLVLLDELPLDIKSYNLKRTHETIQTGVRAYGFYRQAQPFLPYLRPVYYMGRFTLGATPATLGVGWAVSELLSQGTKRLSVHLSHRYAIGLLHDIVFVIGNEAAEVFGGNYRHRDPHWVYGAALADLMPHLPETHGLLADALRETAALALRSEYDRIVLLRCLADGKAPRQGGGSTPGRGLLNDAARAEVAGRLEQFFRRHPEAADPAERKWKGAAEDRLGMKIRTRPVRTGHPAGDRAVAALQSLAGYLTGFKSTPPSGLPALLAETETARQLDPTIQAEVLADLEAAPPPTFDPPALEPDDPLVETLLADLANLAAEVPPRTAPDREAVRSAAIYFRQKDPSGVSKRMDRRAVAVLAGDLDPDSPVKKVSPEAAWVLLGALDADETPRFIYRSVSPDGGDGSSIHFPPYFEPYLMGTDRRLILVARITTDPEIPARTLWTAGPDDPAPELSESRGRAVLTGGTWHWDRAAERPDHPAIVIRGPALNRAFRRGSAFNPLRRRLDGGDDPPPKDPGNPEET